MTTLNLSASCQLLASVIVLSCLGAGIAEARDGSSSTTLSNARISVKIDKISGAVQSIRDREQQVTYILKGSGFEIITDLGNFAPHSGQEGRYPQPLLQWQGVRHQSSLQPWQR